MPTTEIYGFPYETLTDEPGWSLHGGQTGAELILAEEVERQLSRVESELSTATGDLRTDVDLLEQQFLTTGAQVLDYIDTGSGTNTTEFVNIPQDFQNLIILWSGVSDGAGEIDSLALRFNGDGGDNYTSRLTRNTEADAFSSSSGVFSVMRTGYVGTLRATGVAWISDYSVSGLNKYAHGVGVALGQSGGANIFNNQGGGRWSSTAAIQSVRIWVSGQLWGGEPSITLMGVPRGAA